MATPRPKRFEYAIDVDEDGTMLAGGAAPLSPSDDWSPDHLLLAALVRCVIKSLDYHAGRAGLECRASGSARGTVTRREEDGRYAFVEIEADLDASFTPQPTAEVAQDLIGKAERDCFVGSSLTAKPTYRWHVP